MKITVIGDGGWGTAIATLLDGYGHAVTVWGPFEENLAAIRRDHENRAFLPGVPLSERIEWTADPALAAKDAELFVLVAPSKFYADVCRRFVGLIEPTATVVSLTKGLSEENNQRMSELAKEILGLKSIVVMSGPTHAEEVSRKIPTAIVAASEDVELAVKVQKVFSGPYFRVYTSTDPIGVEIGGAIKNVCAIAVGASDGLGFGDNTRAALITRSLAEIKRFGIKLGADPETFNGLSGMGDLIVTCTSRHSRNHSVGERLGKGEKIADITGSMKMVAEGVWNAKVIHDVAEKLGVEMPISEVVYKLCYENYDARDAVVELMSRKQKSE